MTTRLRDPRRARSLSQLQLAELTGVSRQAIAAVELGRSDPSLRLALALASSLGTTVEELFGDAGTRPTAVVEPLAPLGRDGSRVALAPVTGRLVARPLDGERGARSGFAAASGLVGSRPGTVQILGAIRPAVVVAGCDPALALLDTPLGLCDPPVCLLWHSCSSRDALELAADGLVHAAGIHLHDASGESYNQDALRVLGPGSRLVGFAGWRQGLVLRRDLDGHVRDVADVAARGLRIVNREPGSEARSVLARAAARVGLDPATIAGWSSEVPGHLEVAAAIASGLADAGVASEPAARAFDLAFVPLTVERFDLAVPPIHAGSTEVRALQSVLGSAWLRSQLAALPGYDATGCGAEHVLDGHVFDEHAVGP